MFAIRNQTGSNVTATFYLGMEDGKVVLFADDVDCEHWYIATIDENGIHPCSGLPDGLGFPLDDDGAPVIGERD